MKTFLSAVVFAMLALGTIAANADTVPGEDQVSFRIESRTLAEALDRWAQQTGFQMVVPNWELAKKLPAPMLKGRFNALAALEKLLEGSPFTWVLLNQKAVLVREKPRAAPETPSANDKPLPSHLPPSRDGRARDPPEEVVVTAQKHAEHAQDVPIAITVLRGDVLDQSTVQGISEALGRVPGVATPLALQGGETQLSVRGVSAANPVFTGSSAIAYYLDSVPFAMVKTAVAPDADAYDLERVEVLRGPQGSLYGAGSLNGVVRVLTRDADLSGFEMKARGLLSSTAYGGENARGDVAINVPLVEDKVAARALVSYANLSGWIDKPMQENANDAEQRNVRLKLNARPTEELSLGLSAWRSRSDYGAPSFSPDNRTYPALLDEPIATDYDIFGFKLGYEFAAFDLSSATSYLDYTNDSYLDQTLSGIPGFLLQTRFKAQTFAHEINLTSTGSSDWRWSLGGIYRDSTDQTYQNGNQVFVAPQQDQFHSKSYAVFGELTRVLLDGHFELTGGLRYFEDRLTEEEQVNFTGAPAAGVYGRATFDELTPRVVLNWKPNEDAMVYASYSEGFRSGAHHTPAIVAINPSFQPTRPDTLTNYEVGTKSRFAEGRVVADAAVFYIDWRDVQQSLRTPIAGTVIMSTLINSGSASGMGFELGLTTRPSDSLTLGANVSWNGLQFDSDVFSGSVRMFSKGDRLNFSPEVTAGASADWRVPLGHRGYEGKFSAGVNYTSTIRSRRLSATTVQVSDGDSMVIGTTRFSIESPNRWTATVFVDNVSNEQAAYITDWLGVPQRDMRIRPRTVGLQIEYSL